MNSNMRRSMAIGLLVAGALATGACSRGATAGPYCHRRCPAYRGGPLGRYGAAGTCVRAPAVAGVI